MSGLPTVGEDAAGEVYFATLNGNLLKVEGAREKEEIDWHQVAQVSVHLAIVIARLENAGFQNQQSSVPASRPDYF